MMKTVLYFTCDICGGMWKSSSASNYCPVPPVIAQPGEVHMCQGCHDAAERGYRQALNARKGSREGLEIPNP